MLSAERRRRRQILPPCRRLLFQNGACRRHIRCQLQSSVCPLSDDDESAAILNRKQDGGHDSCRSSSSSSSSDYNLYETIGDMQSSSNMASESNMATATRIVNRRRRLGDGVSEIFSPPIERAPPVPSTHRAATAAGDISTSGGDHVMMTSSFYELPLYEAIPRPTGSDDVDDRELVDRNYTIGDVLASFRALAAHLPRVERFAAELEDRARQAEALLLARRGSTGATRIAERNSRDLDVRQPLVEVQGPTARCSRQAGLSRGPGVLDSSLFPQVVQRGASGQQQTRPVLEDRQTTGECSKYVMSSQLMDDTVDRRRRRQSPRLVVGDDRSGRRCRQLNRSQTLQVSYCCFLFNTDCLHFKIH